jgi:1-deoxy-D-xylulose-5-phosphate reductoisomerase
VSGSVPSLADARRDVVVLGSTGSIGTQALDVIARNPDRFRLVGVGAAASTPESVQLLAEQALRFEVDVVAVARAQAAKDLQDALYTSATAAGWQTGGTSLPKVLVGSQSATELAGWPADVVVNALPGSAGLAPTLAALDAGRTLALANKESLIIGGPLVRARSRAGQVVPVDSEHSALAQCLRGGRAYEVRRLVLTASGGPFRGRTRAELAEVTAAQALAHPTWSMGRLVTVNSATMVNKGLEVIEAHLLFGLPLDRIDVVVHPQSVVHSMVEFVDGSTLMQASPPDMRLPISLALGWPDRVAVEGYGCDWTAPARLEFEPLDEDAFPAVGLARTAGTAGGAAPAVYNGANEAAVEAFLAGNAPFLGIVDTVGTVLAEHLGSAPGPTDATSVADELTLEDVLAADAWARTRARELLGVAS